MGCIIIMFMRESCAGRLYYMLNADGILQHYSLVFRSISIKDEAVNA